MDEWFGRFRVYRVVESVLHYNFQDVTEPRLFSVYQSGYGDLQGVVDELRTGDLVEATLAGDCSDETEPWRLTTLERLNRVRTYFATDVRPPDVARELWTTGQGHPRYDILTADGAPVGVCGVQPRSSLPNGAFVPNVLTGLLPLETQFESIPEVEEPAAEAIFIDPDPPDASSYSTPYGVVLLFTETSTTLAGEFKTRYGCAPESDTRPDFDPYSI
jgi:hypothetical protein